MPAPMHRNHSRQLHRNHLRQLSSGFTLLSGTAIESAGFTNAEIIDFIDYVFSKAYRPHDFATMFPALYADDADSREHHYIVVDGTKIVAALLIMYKSLLSPAVSGQAGCANLPFATVGNVAVHPRYRGQNLMREMMGQAIADMQTAGIAFAILGGQRQRYSWYGFESGIAALECGINRANFTGERKLLLTDDLPIAVDEPTSPDEQLIAALDELRRTTAPCHVHEDSGLDSRYTNRECRLAVVRKDRGEGKIAGYAIFNSTPQGLRLDDFAIDASIEPSLFMAALLRSFNVDNIQFTFSSSDLRLTQDLAAWAERIELCNCGRIMLLDIGRCLDFHLRKQMAALSASDRPPVNLRLIIKNPPRPEIAAQCLDLRSDGTIYSLDIHPADNAPPADLPTLELDYSVAVTALCSTSGRDTLTPAQRKLLWPLAYYLPLDLYVPYPDHN